MLIINCSKIINKNIINKLTMNGSWQPFFGQYLLLAVCTCIQIRMCVYILYLAAVLLGTTSPLADFGALSLPAPLCVRALAARAPAFACCVLIKSVRVLRSHKVSPPLLFLVSNSFFYSLFIYCHFVITLHSHA